MVVRFRLSEAAARRFLDDAQAALRALAERPWYVDGVTYRTSMLVPVTRGEGPVFEDEKIRVPRLGPERPYQVVYLPSDPAVSRVRVDISKIPAAIYGTAGMFALVGLVFVAFGLFVMGPQDD